MASELNINTFANNPLDRAALRRTDTDWLTERLNDRSSMIVPLWQLKPLILPGQKKGTQAAIGWLRPGTVHDLIPDEALRVFLGTKDDVAYFAADASAIKDPKQNNALTSMGKFIDLRSIAPDLTPADAAILAQAKSLIDWHQRHAFCAVCGNASQVEEGGYKRVCFQCAQEHFPRTDPVVIALVVKENECLLGRGTQWPPAMYSALAGFVEPGETIEEAVRREVQEETGIEVGKVRYITSQPWPYPSSLMIACIARAKSHAITLDDNELADARWISRNEVIDLLNGKGDGTIWLPPPLAVAHQLIKHWVFEGTND